MKKLLADIYLSMSPIKPEGDDDIRELWIEIPRGSIEDFGDFEEYLNEGLVDTYEAFEQEWKDYYPDQVKWYGFATAKYREEKFYYINSRLCFTISETDEPELNENFQEKDMERFLESLLYRIKEEIRKIKKDVSGYNNYLEMNLSYHKRIGRLLRQKYWEILGNDAVRLDERLGEDCIQAMKTIVEKQIRDEENQKIPEISADDFFRYCEICYDANDYFRETRKNLTPRDKYKYMADGRHGGLTEIENQSKKAFRDWYFGGGKTGAHPWEICRGGNSTHISLMVAESGSEWTLRLAGSSIVRVEETVKMAVALFKNNIPFILQEGEAILQMITGKDYIGIVPDHIFPRYCHGLFPKEDRIIDFMNLGYENTEAIISNAYWYPLKPIIHRF